MNSPYAILTLEELKTLRAEFLAEGQKLAPALRKIITTLGKPQIDPTGRMPLNFQGIAGAGWQAYFWEIDDARDVRGKCWHTHGRLWIEYGNQVPVRLEYADGDLNPLPGSVFIPGRWIDELLALEVQADQVIQSRCDIAETCERERLIVEMGIGVLI